MPKTTRRDWTAPKRKMVYMEPHPKICTRHITHDLDLCATLVYVRLGRCRSHQPKEDHIFDQHGTDEGRRRDCWWPEGAFYHKQTYKGKLRLPDSTLIDRASSSCCTLSLCSNSCAPVSPGASSGVLLRWSCNSGRRWNVSRGGRSCGSLGVPALRFRRPKGKPINKARPGGMLLQRISYTTRCM